MNRRTALKTGAAVAVTATLGFPMTAKAGDSELLARVATFWKSYEDHEKKGETSHALYEKMLNRPDFPGFEKAGSNEWDKCARRSGYRPAFDIWCMAGKKMGAAANTVFAIPAKTLRGAVEKMKIARCAVGYTDDGSTGDGDLECYQDHNAPWIDNALADLDRLAGGAA